MSNYSHVSFMFCMPRSRSQWMSYFMGFGCVAWHDPLKHCEHPLDLLPMIDEWTAKNPGRRLFIADTLAGSFGKQIMPALPGALFFKVLRPIEEVRASITRAQGCCSVSTALANHWRRMYELHTELELRYTDLDNPTALLNLFNVVTEAPHKMSEARLDRALSCHIDYPLHKQVADARRLEKLMRHLDL